MTVEDEPPEEIASLLAAPDLAGALESEQFRHFLDQIPIAMVVSVIDTPERIVYANPEFEKLSGQGAADIAGKPWSAALGHVTVDDGARTLADAVIEASDRVGAFPIQRPDSPGPVTIDVYSNVIEDDQGKPVFRLAALVEARAHAEPERQALEQRLREKDTLLRELQHRVKNNLQMITTLIRLEARNAPAGAVAEPFDRLAGRIESLQLLYQSLSDDAGSGEVDLGIYLSQIAAAVMRTHAVEGIRLDLKVDTYPVSVNVAMPAGLVVNELLTNALKYAFEGRDGGTIALRCLAEPAGCQVVVADDGVGLPEGVTWPKRGKLGALIVQSLRENARATLNVESKPGQGVTVTIVFTRAAAAA